MASLLNYSYFNIIFLSFKDIKESVGGMSLPEIVIKMCSQNESWRPMALKNT